MTELTHTLIHEGHRDSIYIVKADYIVKAEPTLQLRKSCGRRNHVSDSRTHEQRKELPGNFDDLVTEPVDKFAQLPFRQLSRSICRDQLVESGIKPTRTCFCLTARMREREKAANCSVKIQNYEKSRNNRRGHYRRRHRWISRVGLCLDTIAAAKKPPTEAGYFTDGRFLKTRLIESTVSTMSGESENRTTIATEMIVNWSDVFSSPSNGYASLLINTGAGTESDGCRLGSFRGLRGGDINTTNNTLMRSHMPRTSRTMRTMPRLSKKSPKV